MRKTAVRALAATAVAAGTATALVVGLSPHSSPTGIQGSGAPLAAAALDTHVGGSTTFVPLTPQPVGTAKLTVGQAGQVTAQLNLTGLAPGTAHTVEVVPGACSAGVAPVLSFGTVSANGVGAVDATVSSTQKVYGSLPREATFVIRTGSDTTPDADKPSACAPLPEDRADEADLRIQPQSDELAPLWGTAALTYRAGQHTLTVRIQASGLAPFSQHAAHIHSGSCEAQGPVVFMTPTLFADAQGRIDSTTTITGVTSPPPATGWYVNLHLGNMDQILANGNPTILFRPLLCGNVTR